MAGLALVVFTIAATATAQLSPDEIKARMADLNHKAATRPYVPPPAPLPEPNFVRTWHVRDGAPEYIKQWIADQPKLRLRRAAIIDERIAQGKKLLDAANRDLHHLALSQPKMDIQTDSNGAAINVANSDDIAQRRELRKTSSEQASSLKKVLAELTADRESTLHDQNVLILPELPLRVGGFGILYEAVKVEHVSRDKEWVVARLTTGDVESVNLYIKTDASVIVDGMVLHFDDKPLGIKETKVTDWGSTLLSAEEAEYEKWVYQVTEDHTPGHAPATRAVIGPVKLAKPVPKYSV